MSKRLMVFALITLGYKAQAQLKVLPPQIASIQQQLQKVSAMSYDYTIEQRLPDGGINKTKGRVIIGKNFYKETNTEQLTIQTDRWFYKLDHASKSVFIVDVNKVKNKVFKGKMSTNPFSVIPDSIVARYGQIDFKTNGNIAKINIGFTKDVLINSLYLEYDLKKQIPLVYKVQMKVLYGIDGWEYQEKYLDQYLTASNFLLKATFKPGELEEYFNYENGKVKLKKYSQYKLIQQI